MFTDRRSVLAGAAVLAAVPVAAAMAQTQPPAGRNPAAMPMPDVSGVRTAMQFAAGVIGPAELSLATSQIAVERATNAMAKEFAGFELAEAIATLEMIRAASNGTAFDHAYITAQIENHEFLRDLATAYLRNSAAGTGDMAEKHGRHLATLALATFTEHVALTRRISGEIRA